MVLTNKLTKMNKDEWSLQYFWTTTKIMLNSCFNNFPLTLEIEATFSAWASLCSPQCLKTQCAVTHLPKGVSLPVLASFNASRTGQETWPQRSPINLSDLIYSKSRSYKTPHLPDPQCHVTTPPKLLQISASWMKRMALLLCNEWSWLLFSLFGIYVF